MDGELYEYNYKHCYDWFFQVGVGWVSLLRSTQLATLFQIYRGGQFYTQVTIMIFFILEMTFSYFNLKAHVLLVV